ncbi:zinc-dependent alcohol dehydrogenase [Arthrobacter psychrochitiniphilus]|uniref:zinc-dependent alcohol dehydrogenase n=1 Tax=Arthrobacter psychrochitiniphilus TaxID=291045 RepID=UPI003F7B74E1
MSTDQERRRVIITAPSAVEITTQPVREPSSAEALVRMTLAGVCGSDTTAVGGHHPMIALPYYPGHEVVGTVVRIGPDVTSTKVGSRVTVIPPLPCGTCKTCRDGRNNLCENMEFFGCGWIDGGMADTFTVRADRLYAVPGDFSDEQAALIEPLATPVHAARIAGDLTNKTVVIQGAGTIGLLMLAAARAAGARTIVMTDVLKEKLEKAKSMGADDGVDALLPNMATIVREKLGESADYVFDCVANQYTIEAAVSLATKGGTVVVVGVPHGNITVPLHLVQDHQIRIQGTITYLEEDYDKAVAIIRNGHVSPTDFITGRYPISQAAEAFRVAVSGKHTKVLITAEKPSQHGMPAPSN